MKIWHVILILGLLGGGFALYWFVFRKKEGFKMIHRDISNPEANTTTSPAQANVAAAASTAANDVVGMTLTKMKSFGDFFSPNKQV